MSTESLASETSELFLQSPVATLSYDRTGLLVECNRMAEQMFGLSRDAVVGVYNVLENPQNIEIGVPGYFARALEGEIVRHPSVLFHPPAVGGESGGDPFWLQATYAPLRDGEDRVVGVVEIDNDITEARLELSTPVIPITDNALVLPLIGTLDAARMTRVAETVLEGAARHQARTVIIDITGAGAIESAVAASLIDVVRAVGLLGARVMLTGMQPRVAEALVDNGVGLSGVQTYANLQIAIRTLLNA